MATQKTPSTTRSANVVLAVGTLETQRVGKGKQQEEAVVTQRWNKLQGCQEQVQLQMVSPFGTPYRLPLHLDTLINGQAVLAELGAGTPLAVEGTLEWTMTEDVRYAITPQDRGRRTSEVQFHVTAIRPATDADQPGCDCLLEGVVLTPARVLPHPDKPIRMAITTLQVNVERTRTGSRARIMERAHVTVAIPVDHPDTPNLMRPGNKVVVEGMLERLIVAQTGDDVKRAVAAVDARWSGDQAPANRDQAKQYAKQRRRLQEAVRSRVIAGYVELVEGTAATVAESLLMRRDRARQRRADQSARQATQRGGEQGAADPRRVAAPARVEVAGQPEHNGHLMAEGTHN